MKRVLTIGGGCILVALGFLAFSENVTTTVETINPAQEILSASSLVYGSGDAIEACALVQNKQLMDIAEAGTSSLSQILVDAENPFHECVKSFCALSIPDGSQARITFEKYCKAH